MANSTPSCSPRNALWILEREFKTVWNFFFFFDWLNLKNRRYPYRSLCITVVNAPTQKESTNIIPSLFPLQIIFFCQRRKFVCILTRRCFLSFIAVSWTSCLRYAAGYLYWHCSLSGLATRSVYPIFMPKVSCFLAVNFIPVSVPVPLVCDSIWKIQFWRRLLRRVPRSSNWLFLTRQNSLPCDSQSKTLQGFHQSYVNAI